MLRALPGQLTRSWALKLPPVLQRVLLDAMLEKYGHLEVFRELCRELHVSGAIVSGTLGQIAGGVEDKTILPAYMGSGTWQLGMQFVYTSFFNQHKGGTFLDIGANIGLTTISLAKYPGITCHVFEPEPRNFGYLCRNIAENCPPNSVVPHQIALFDEKSTLEFELSPDNLGDHRVRATSRSGELKESSWRTVSVAADRLDDVLDLSTLTRPIAVKIDTQGAEPKVIAGGRQILASADLLSLEFWPYGMARIGGDVEEMIAFLEQNFREASILEHDQEVPSDWQPVAPVAARLRKFWGERATLGHVPAIDVLFRK
jgi:FkbM family methyltransferase